MLVLHLGFQCIELGLKRSLEVPVDGGQDDVEVLGFIHDLVLHNLQVIQLAVLLRALEGLVSALGWSNVFPATASRRRVLLIDS